MSAWRNRIVCYAQADPHELIANPLNWRNHPDAQAQALTGVLEDIGIVQNVIVNKNTGRLVDGHLRVMLALKTAQATVPVTYVDLSEEEERLVLATLDPLASMAETDADTLADLLNDVSSDSPAVMDMLDQLMQEAGLVYEEPEPDDEDEFADGDEEDEAEVVTGKSSPEPVRAAAAPSAAEPDDEEDEFVEEDEDDEPVAAAPATSSAAVPEIDQGVIELERRRLQDQLKHAADMVGVICPNCLHEFHVTRKDFQTGA